MRVRERVQEMDREMVREMAPRPRTRTAPSQRLHLGDFSLANKNSMRSLNKGSIGIRVQYEFNEK